jgi:hypothetical protein
MLRHLVAAAVFALLGSAALAQTCSSGTDLFLKNDNLPQVPGTQTVSVIPGLCDGEAMGCVFDVSGQQYSNEVKVKMCAGAYINVANASGIAAIVNLQIYDGITWSGNIPTLGTQVFDFENASGANIQFNSSGINTVDISNFNVRCTSGKLVVVFEMLMNTASGSCATGYQTNFATDNTLPACSAPCSPLRKNLIYIQGQGWRDPMTATVSGIPICSCYYAGNWIIRACVEPVGYPRTYCTGKVNSGNCTPSIGWTGTPTLNTGPNNFHIRCTSVLNNKSGLFFWGFQTPATPPPFNGGYLCVSQPVVRTAVQNSGGNTTGVDCTTGAYDFYFSSAYAQSFGLATSTDYYGEWWMRDPAHFDGTNVGFSNAINWRFPQ